MVELKQNNSIDIGYETDVCDIWTGESVTKIVVNKYGRNKDLGTGTRDLVSECEAMGLKTPQYVEDTNFKTIIWRKNVTQNVTQNDTQNDSQNDSQNQSRPLPKRMKKVLELISADITIPAEDLAKKLKVSTPTIYRDIKKLHIHWEGPSKTGHWVINL